MKCRPLRDPVFLAAGSLLLLLTARLAAGTTLWYDEAWRMVIALRDPDLPSFLARWFFEGWPLPVAPVPYLALVRIVHGSLGWPGSETLLRALSVGAAAAALPLVYRSAFHLAGDRAAARVAVLLLAANAYLGSFAAAIKEHALVSTLVLWILLRAIERAKGLRSFALLDPLLAWGTTLLSTIALPALGFVFLAELLLRPRGSDVRRFAGAWAVILLPCLLWAGALMHGVRLQETAMMAMMPAHGIPPAPVWRDVHVGEWSIASFFAQLNGFRFNASGPAALAAWLAWTAILLIALHQASRRLEAALVPLALALLPLLEMTVLARGLAMTPPRYFLWSAAVFSLAAALVLARPRAPFPILRGVVIVLLLVSTFDGWRGMLASFPSKQRFDLFITRLGDVSFDRARDVVVHHSGLTYLPHEVFDPDAAKRVLFVPEEGLGSLMLKPGFPNRCIDTPLDRFWTDTDLRAFEGGAVWSPQPDGPKESVNRRLRENLFGGNVRVDSYPGEVITWMRFSAAESAAVVPSTR